MSCIKEPFHKQDPVVLHGRSLLYVPFTDEVSLFNDEGKKKFSSFRPMKVKGYHTLQETWRPSIHAKSSALLCSRAQAGQKQQHKLTVSSYTICLMTVSLSILETIRGPPCLRVLYNFFFYFFVLYENRRTKEGKGCLSANAPTPTHKREKTDRHIRRSST